MAHASTGMNIEQQLHKFEEKVRRESHATSISFWGTITLHPDKVYVSPEEAERSMKSLEEFVKQTKSENPA